MTPLTLTEPDAMSVTLTPELEAEIAARVASGRYPSSESVLTEALAALSLKEQHEAKRAALVADIAAGDASLAAGLGVQITATQILAELRAKRGS
jgi:putative addiction module CopG family antidote